MKEFFVFFVQCTLAALFNVLLCPHGIANYVVRLGVTLGIAIALRWLLNVPSPAEGVEAFLSGQARRGRLAVLVVATIAGNMVACIGDIPGSTPSQVFLSGFFHGFLLSLDQHPQPNESGRRMFGTFAQVAWLSGVLYPICTQSWAWIAVSPCFVAFGALYGILLGHQLDKRTAGSMRVPTPLAATIH
jgi:hypothetical protein